MCLIALALQPHPALRLLLVANRDEFHARPSTPLAAWPDEPTLIAGRDGEAHGTWLGISQRGRLAAVTNVRLPGLASPGLRSRGALPVDFLVGDHSAGEHLQALSGSFADYGPCNLLLVDAGSAWYASNRPGVAAQRLVKGLWGLSNAALDTPWPKTLCLKAAMATWLERGRFDDVEPLFTALADRRLPPDAALPDTGVGIDRERVVAPAFIKGATYGTRCSTVIRIDGEGQGLIVERRFGPDGIPDGESSESFRWA